MVQSITSIFSGPILVIAFDELELEYVDDLFGPSLIICGGDHTLTFPISTRMASKGFHRKDEENKKSIRETHQISDEWKKKDLHSRTSSR